MSAFQVPELAKQYTEYDMIQTHTELPDFPASRARLLCAFLEQNPKPDVPGELYALAASLVQLGLDTHERVSVSNEAKDKKTVRARQLKVLAGDYFSSGFYHLLAQAGQIEMVRQLTAAICEVNRTKMTLYARVKQLKLSAEEYIRETVRIRTQLFEHFDRLMQGVQHRLWPEILESVACCEVLVGELAKSDEPQDFRGSWGFWHILQTGTREERKHLVEQEHEDNKLRPLLLKYNIKGQLYGMLEEQAQRLLDKAKQLDSERLRQELVHMGDSFLRLVRQPKVLEER